MSDQDTLAIRNINGDTRQVKTRLPWGKERKILKIIGDAVAQIPEKLSAFDELSPGIALLQYFTTEAPEKVTEMLSIILALEPDKVEEDYDGDAVIEFMVPFTTHYLQKWGKRLEAIPLDQIGLLGLQTPKTGLTGALETQEAPEAPALGSGEDG
jgi:hypothetical protein